MSFRQRLSTPRMIRIMLLLQFLPMLPIFPPEVFFNPKSQDWWLPIILALLALVSAIQILRRSIAIWPWHLIGFSQGFNIISRLMMIFPHVTYNEAGSQYFNTSYVVISILSMVVSAFLLWYAELPEVRMSLLRE
jgi:hypothetical protein